MYSREFMAAVLTDLAELDDGSPVISMLTDYGRLRDQVRKCQ